MVRHCDRRETGRAPCKQHVERNEGALIAPKSDAQARAKGAVSADALRYFRAHDALQRKLRELGRQPAPQPVWLPFWCPIYYIESIVQLSDELWDVLRCVL